MIKHPKPITPENAIRPSLIAVNGGKYIYAEPLKPGNEKKKVKREPLLSR